jgi:rhamnulokinase
MVRKMSKYFLAIDIGASSGRHILGSVENNKIVLEEIYRFWNGMDNVDGTLVWDVDRLLNEILTGMKKCKEIGKIPESVGIDTWGVDYVLLDKEDKIVGQTVGYRDHRTDGIDEEVYKIIPEDDLYARTGIQKAIFNTIYQLAAVKKYHPEHLEEAETLLFIPDYFHYKLCGKKVNEYSEATTGQLINPYTKDWDYELLDMMGFPKEIFQKVEMPGTVLGGLTDEVKELVGYDCKVVIPPTHDTASAVMAIPTNEEDACYISSGTWSLMGVERDEPDCSPAGKEANFTNEGGYGGKITYLANIMGLWMIQSVRNELAPDMSYGELCDQASKETIKSIVDCQDESFLSPDDMVQAVKDYCKKTDQEVPQTLPALASVIYNSLAKCYADELKKIEKLTGKKYSKINIIGGGSNAVYLNELTASYTGAEVHAGPGEATAIGNLLTQMLEAGEFTDLKQARSCVADSFDVKVYRKA